MKSDSYGRTVFANLWSGPPRWHPVIDGYILLYDHGNALRLGAHAEVPIMTGNNPNENDGVASNVSESKNLWTEVFQKYFSEFFSLYPAKSAAQAKENSDAVLWKEWLRLVFETGPGCDAKEAQGQMASVTSLTPLLQRKSLVVLTPVHQTNNIAYSDNSTVSWNESDYKVESVMSSCWAKFTRTDNPNSDGLTYWSPSSDNKTAMHLGKYFGAVPIAKSAERISFLRRWMSLLHEYWTRRCRC
ncbi:Carboxylesterase [Penicillium brevicompactum]